MDKFENHIIKHRQEFDSHMPDPSLWKKIEDGLQIKKPKSVILYWKIAAILFFVLSLGLLFQNLRTDNNFNSITGTDPEFKNTEDYYLGVIKEKESILLAYKAEYPDLAADFKHDLDELSGNYKKLRLDYEITHSSTVLNALIKNLQLQQQLLTNQLRIIQLTEKENEDVSI